ncbi:MAG: DUF1585 domain-containing protein, partial [Polyangiales bacterium]
KSFTAGNMMLKPSTEPNLMKREGCMSCHGALEPLAAYFSRVVETDWTYLPKTQFPLSNAECKPNPQGKVPGFCKSYYDPAFTDDAGATLFGAYASPAHAEAGPAGAGAAIASNADFATCAVERIATGFLGRPLAPEDETLTRSLLEVFSKNGFRMKPLVRSLVSSDAYRHATTFGGTKTGGAQ